MHNIMLELLDDEEAEVKHLAIEGFLDNIDKFTEKNIEENLLPIVMGLINDMNSTTNSANHITNEKLESIFEHSEYLRKLF